jgi:hypothetical protein
LQRVFHGIRFKVNEDWLSRDNLLFLKQVFGLPGTCFSFVKALTLRFIYRKSSLLLLGKQSLLLLWEALSLAALPASKGQPAQPPDIHGWSALDAGVACLSLRACTGKGCRPLRASGAVSIYRLRG